MVVSDVLRFHIVEDMRGSGAVGRVQPCQMRRQDRRSADIVAGYSTGGHPATVRASVDQAIDDRRGQVSVLEMARFGPAPRPRNRQLEPYGVAPMPLTKPLWT